MKIKLKLIIKFYHVKLRFKKNFKKLIGYKILSNKMRRSINKKSKNRIKNQWKKNKKIKD